MLLCLFTLLDDVSVKNYYFIKVLTDAFAAEECFVRPNEFIPERWYSQPELVKEKDAHAPFSLGMLT